MTLLDEMLGATPYASYAYSYPHKTAYRALAEPVSLSDLWAAEPKGALFLYLHVPFCEMRCGFCNLFTTANPNKSLEAQYLDALTRQASRVREAIGPSTVARMAVGGGTPTYLAPDELHSLFNIAEKTFGANLTAIPISVETSPRTAEPEKLAVLAMRGVDRVSIGVQSFQEAEVAAIGRAQKTALVRQALENIRAAKIPSLNIDLMYGLPGQTVKTWLQSLRDALRFAPEELYLYPLYVRPLTGLDRSPKQWDDIRLACYRAGRDFLREAGYAQVSMRMFRAAHAPDAQKAEGPLYCCQEDGMVGLGCGARSYTQNLHYSEDYAVGRTGVKAILADYVAKPDQAFDVALYGAALNREEQRRRYVIKSLLQTQGLDLDAYRRAFGGSALDDLPQLAELMPRGLATSGPATRGPATRGPATRGPATRGPATRGPAMQSEGRLRLTDTGLEWSDVLGPWLYSDPARRLMGAFALK